ncbi:MAG: 30S ribosomal protein S4 [Bacilli bacterium]|jgi:small subunit ribosomal protein S4|nr:30S ribosomal protein S4 [Bacilli bacterium]MDY0064380.1 30S ribosomal protein S4 [Bacilli bacterium]
MARYTGPSWKQSRRLGFSVLESGKEFALGKNGKERRRYAPGQHGQRRTKLSEYGVQLQEKQKVRFTYGMNERQFRRFFDIAGKMQGNRGDNFMILLESRLDNLVYRLGFAATRRQARQLVNHAHFTVNGNKVDIPSYIVKPGQTIAVKETSRKLTAIQDALAGMVSRKEYLSFDENKLEGTLLRLPERSEFMTEIKDNLIVEFYNR